MFFNDSFNRLSFVFTLISLIFSLISGDILHAGVSLDDTSKREDVKKARRVVITPKELDRMSKLPGDIGPLQKIIAPSDNPQTKAKIELGKMLFFDKRLSGDNSISCATCHDPRKGFSDGKERAIGFRGMELGRHTPTVLNAAYNSLQFWDGRAPSLEKQALGPIEAEGEMNLRGDELVIRLKKIPEYNKRFQKVFGEDINFTNVGKAIAAFERTIVTPDSSFDRYAGGDKKALNEQEKRGLILFVGKAACSQCHSGPNFSDNSFYALGVPQKGPIKEDFGRYAVTEKEEDKGAFKTPTVRNIALTAPYMHDGAFKSLEEVIDFYNDGGGSVFNKSEKVAKLNLTAEEKMDLLAFLNALTGELPVVTAPQLP